MTRERPIFEEIKTDTRIHEQAYAHANTQDHANIDKVLENC
jgi:hypothetical protein